MKTTRYKGLIAAAFTPFKENGELDLDKIPGLVESACKEKLSGLFVCGSTGEFASMTTQERMQTAEAFLNSAKGKMPILVHVGSCSIDESITLAKHARDNGAVAVATLAPFYFRVGSDAKMLTEVLKKIAGSVPEMPFYYYHLPCATGANIAMNDFLPLAEKEIPNLAGVKFTNEDLMDYQRSVEYSGDRMQIMFGRDEILLASLSLGAEAAVGSTFNYGAWIYHRIIAAFENGNIAEAAKWQSVSQKLVGLLQKFGPGAHKGLMKLSGVDAGYSRCPLPDLNSAEMKELECLAKEIFCLKDV